MAFTRQRLGKVLGHLKCDAQFLADLPIAHPAITFHGSDQETLGRCFQFVKFTFGHFKIVSSQFNLTLSNRIITDHPGLCVAGMACNEICGK